MLGTIRGLFTLAGVAGAGALVWLATLLDVDRAATFWAAMGLIAAGGFALGLSQLFGGWTKWGMPRVSPGVFLFGFLPTLVVTGWILLATQPQGGPGQGLVSGWSGTLGILGFVDGYAIFQGAVAFVFGLVLAFVFDTAGPRDRRVEGDRAVTDEDVHDYRRDDEMAVDGRDRVAAERRGEPI